MNFEQWKMRSRSDKSGVSEVIGNILILMITVILFSSIVMYVNQIPVPETTTKADFAATITFETSGTTTASLTVTHAGGVSLAAVDTAILLHIDSTTQYYDLSEDTDFDHTTWYMGIDWTKNFTVPSPASEITVTVIDLAKAMSVWVSQVSGGTGGNAPIVLQRYADALASTPSADPVLLDGNFSLFAKVIDLDNDLDNSSVYVDASNVGGGSEKYADAETSDGWFRFDFIAENGFVTDVTDVDGKIVKFHATDDAGHTTISSYMMSVTVLPSHTYWDTPESPAYEGGLPSYITWMSDGQGIGIYHATPDTGAINLTLANTFFVKDEKAFIRVASLRLDNIGGTNSLVLVDTRTGFIYTPSYTGSSAAALPFYEISSAGGAFMYECQFNTTGLPPSAYSMSISLKSAGSVTAVFQTTQTIIISQTGSSISFSPAMWLFCDEDREVPWGTKTQPFDLSVATTSQVFVSVKVQDAASSPDPSVDDVRIVDMRGDTQLDGTPPSGSMLTSWEANTTESSNQTYEFMIDLRLNNGDQWIGGAHAYTLKISRFADVNEGVYSLSKMVYVTANTAKADFFIGSAGFVTGTSNFVDPQYLYQVVNNNFFSLRSLYDYSNAPSAADCYATSALTLGDIDGDGDKDILMGQYGSHKLYFIENSLNTFGSWQDATIIQRPTTDDTDADINWIATGDINGDGDTDFAYSTSYYSSMGRTVVIYNNTYGTTGSVFTTYGTDNSGVRKIALEDMTGDGRADLIVLGEGKVDVFDLMDWDPDAPIATIGGSNANIIDFDIADVNYDGMMDIVTVDNDVPSDVDGVWLSYYSASIAPTEKLLTDCTAIPFWGEADASHNQTSYTFDIFEDDGAALILSENSSAESVGAGKLNWTCQLSEALTSDPDQELTVRAKVGAGAVEGFYIWYSTDNDVYIPLIYISPDDTDYVNNTVWLPSTVVGKQIWLRVTDSISTNSSGDDVDTVYLDYIAVLTDTFGDYDDCQEIVPQTEGYICARAGNINGDQSANASDRGLEIIVAKDGVAGWKVLYKSTDVVAPDEDWDELAGWTDGSATFYCKGAAQIDLHSSMNSDEGPVRAVMSNSAPRLFVVTDINGDGYDDVIVVNSTINEDITSQVALYLNLHDTGPWWYCVVKDIAAEYNVADVRGGMTFLAVENLLL